MDIETAKLAFQVLQFLITGGIAIYVYLATKDRVTNKRIDDLEDALENDIEGHSERIAVLESVQKQSPTHKDLAEIHEKMNDIGKDVSNMTGEFSGVKRLLTTIHEYMLGSGK